MKRINQGFIVGDTYKKRVSFNKAVLWKDKQISLHPKIVAEIKRLGVKKIVFEDFDKKQRWIISAITFLNNAHLRQVGQESQWYIGIGLFEKTDILQTS